jgi:hypothetical protein
MVPRNAGGVDERRRPRVLSNQKQIVFLASCRVFVNRE